MSINENDFARQIAGAQCAIREDMQRAMMQTACAESAQIVGRAYGIGAPIGIAEHPAWVPVGLEPDNLPPGEAFTRESVRNMLRIAREEAVKRDRLRLQADGWTLRGAAAKAFMDILADVMTRQNVPGDAAAAILGECAVMMADWE